MGRDTPSERPATSEHARDLDLVARLNGGDERAFDELYSAHRDWVHRLAFRFTGDAELALDVLQETFSYFAAKFPGFELRSRLRTFLYPVVKHTAASFARRAHRNREAQASETLDELPAPAPAPSAGADPGDESLRAVVRRLPAAQREVLLLRYVDDIEQEEIAEALGIPVGTVKSRLHHAHRALRDDPALRDVLARPPDPPP